jgi:hypothetical protein
VTHDNTVTAIFQEAAERVNIHAASIPQYSSSRTVLQNLLIILLHTGTYQACNKWLNSLAS